MLRIFLEKRLGQHKTTQRHVTGCHLFGRLLKSWLVVGAMGWLSLTQAGFVDGVNAYNRGDYGRAVEEFIPLAQAGDAWAQFNLAVMYDNGRGVEQDFEKAVYWYRIAAEQGDADAQFNLGGMYIKGLGTTQDFAQGAYWYRKAANQGEKSAYNNLGLLYMRGMGVKQNPVVAYVLFQLAQSHEYNALTKATRNRDVIRKQLSEEQLQQADDLLERVKVSGLHALDEFMGATAD